MSSYLPQPLPDSQERAIAEMWDALTDNIDVPGYEKARQHCINVETKIRANWAKAEKIRAAAPELLEQLIEAKKLILAWHSMGVPEQMAKGINDVYESQAPEMQRINAAIKKATE